MSTKRSRRTADDSSNRRVKVPTPPVPERHPPWSAPGPHAGALFVAAEAPSTNVKTCTACGTDVLSTHKDQYYGLRCSSDTPLSQASEIMFRSLTFCLLFAATWPKTPHLPRKSGVLFTRQKSAQHGGSSIREFQKYATVARLVRPADLARPRPEAVVTFGIALAARRRRRRIGDDQANSPRPWSRATQECAAAL